MGKRQSGSLNYTSHEKKKKKVAPHTILVILWKSNTENVKLLKKEFSNVLVASIKQILISRGVHRNHPERGLYSLARRL